MQILRNFAALCSSVLKYLSVFVSSSMALKIRLASVKFRCAKELSPMRRSAFMRAHPSSSRRRQIPWAARTHALSRAQIYPCRNNFCDPHLHRDVKFAVYFDVKGAKIFSSTHAAASLHRLIFVAKRDVFKRPSFV